MTPIMPDQDTCLIDGYGPIPVVRPQSAAEVGDLVRRAGMEGSAIYPLGGRTMLNLGMPPTRPGVAVDLRRLDQVIDYPARDMTITVQAGIKISKLQALLGKENQQLPIDVPFPHRATLGGAIATNVSGPRRYGYGTLRDYIIGISIINDEGQETKAGGRVVKNVAGYDLCKLHIGALGTLGIVSQVTLKLKPLPQDSALILLQANQRVGDILDCLHETRTRPVAITVISEPAFNALIATLDECKSIAFSDRLIVVGVEGNADAVAWQTGQLQHELAEFGSPICVHQRFAAHRIRSLLDTFSYLPETVLSFRMNVPPSAIASFCDCFSDSKNHLGYQAQAGNGVITGHLEPESLEQSTDITGLLLAFSNTNHGNLILVRCPPAWKKDLPVWGNPRPDDWLMRAVKDKLDPRGIFNPGRFVAGI